MSDKYRGNYNDINWVNKVPTTFKTSWGAEYTLMLKEEKDKEDVTKYNSPSLKPTIDDLVEKSRKEELIKKKK